MNKIAAVDILNLYCLVTWVILNAAQNKLKRYKMMKKIEHVTNILDKGILLYWVRIDICFFLIQLLWSE